MRFLLFIVLFFICRCAHTQDFAMDWQSFQVKGWKLTISKTPTSFFTYPSVGSLVFSNGSSRIGFTVIAESRVDSAYQKVVNDWNFVQSCGHIGHDKFFLGSFSWQGYRYELTPCHNCNLGLDGKCRLLAQALLQRFAR